MKIRVLIFDDEDMIRALFKIALKDKGYEIFDSATPASCPVYQNPECDCPLNEMCADIIISDIRMPEVNGLQFVKEQKKKGCKVTNIVLISAFVDKAIEKEATDMGCKILRKPFHIDELLAVLEEFEKNIDPNRTLAPWDEIGD